MTESVQTANVAPAELKLASTGQRFLIFFLDTVFVYISFFILGASSMLALLTPVDDRLYFRACTPSAGCEPWVTDGSGAGTHRLADIRPGSESGLGWTWERFVPSGRLLYFRADDGTGTELWAMPLELLYDGFETGNTGRWSPP